MEIEELFGLPAHPLLVHAAVVLVPLAALAFAATMWRPSWRQMYALPILGLAVMGAVSAFLAVQSGEPVEHMVRQAAEASGSHARIGEHPEQGETAWIFALLFAIGVSGFWALENWKERLRLRPWALPVAYGLVLAPALGAVITMIVAGHSGAKLVWNDASTFATAR